MTECPLCRTPLTRHRGPHGFLYQCPNCGGRSASLALLRKSGAQPAILRALWQGAITSGAVRAKPCPHCRKPMAEARVNTDHAALALDVCKSCAMVWFDPSEFDALPKRSAAMPIQPPRPKLSPKSAEALAQFRLKAMREKEDNEGPSDLWQALPALLGMPVEMDAPAVSRLPLVTWSLGAACVMATVMTFVNFAAGRFDVRTAEGIIQAYGFIPAEFWRLDGLTLVTSFFLHGGLLHLTGNLYFLVVFGDNVEDRLGPLKFVLLAAGAHLAGMALHGMFCADKSAPCIGASAGISGVIAFYAIAFPRVRLGLYFMFHYGLFIRVRWLCIPALGALFLYVLLQLFGAWMQIRGFSSVSALGHLGGLALGAAAALRYKLTVRKEREEAMG